ncbi:MAG TPA: hypothetical protein VFR70_08075 [Flavobacterium sp.]|nr:hypothetical protein [Flavobacterium sp.]
MNYRAVKYCVLAFFGLLTIKHYIHFGDYCTGVPDGFAWILFCTLFILSAIGYFLIDICKKKFDKYVLIIFAIAAFLNIASLALPESVFSKKIYLKGIIEKESSRDRNIELYKNKTFKIKVAEIEWNCYFIGKYETKNNLLILTKEDISQKTGNYFTNKYKIDIKNQVLIPLEKEFDTIKLIQEND